MHVREMLSEDYEAVQRVRSENGFGCLSRGDWDHFENTPHRAAGCELPIGWVLEDNDRRVVGIHGVYPVRYQYRGRRLTAGVAHTLAVDPDHRLSTVLLMAPFFGLENVDLVLSTSANRAAAQYFQYNKANRFPVAWLSTSLTWVVSYRKVTAAALQKKQVPCHAACAVPAAAAVWVRDLLQRRNRFGPRTPRVRCIDAFDDRFDRFWMRLVERSPHLLAMRDRASLQWHFEFCLRSQRVRILVMEDGGEMVGYLILLRELRQQGQLLDRYYVVDLQLLDPQVEHVEALMCGALRLASSEDMGMVDVVGLGSAKRQILEAMRPYARTSDQWPFWYKETHSIEGLDLTSTDAWDPTMLDGDATIWNEHDAS